MATALTGIAELVTNDPARDGTPLGIIDDAAVVVEDGRVAWVGARGGGARGRRASATSAAAR